MKLVKIKAIKKSESHLQYCINYIFKLIKNIKSPFKLTMTTRLDIIKFDK